MQHSRWAVLLAAILCLLLPMLAAADDAGAALPPEVHCTAYAVISQETGQVLLAKNGSMRAYPASTTKVMTMGLVLDSGLSMDTLLTTTQAAVAEIHADSTQMYLAVGEELTVRDLLYGTEVRSANDAANVLAEGVAGSKERFVQMMNDQARALGLTGTHFMNAHGLPDAEHYTTALDLAQIARWSLSVEGFREIFSTYTYRAAATNLAEERPMTTTCDILNPNTAGYYAKATGAKLGWTVDSKYTLVTAGTDQGLELICVVLGEATDSGLYADTAALLDYCFDNFRRVEITPSLPQEKIPIYDSMTRVGDAELLPDSFGLLLHRELGESDLSWEAQLPARWELDSQPPVILFRLNKPTPFQASPDCAFPLRWEEHLLSGYGDIQQTALDLTTPQRPLSEVVRELLWVLIPASFVILFLLVTLFVQLFNRKTDRLRYESLPRRNRGWRLAAERTKHDRKIKF